MKQIFYLLLIPSEKIEYLLITLSSFDFAMPSKYNTLVRR